MHQLVPLYILIIIQSDVNPHVHKFIHETNPKLREKNYTLPFTNDNVDQAMVFGSLAGLKDGHFRIIFSFQFLLQFTMGWAKTTRDAPLLEVHYQSPHIARMVFYLNLVTTSPFSMAMAMAMETQ